MRKGGLYLAIGDSWTWATNTTTTRGNQYYANKIRDAIRADFGACRLINKGIGGTTSGKMVQSIPWLMSLEPDLVTIGVGTNDLVNNSVPVATYKNNLITLIDALRVRNPDVDIILCTPGRSLDPNRLPYIQPFRTAMEEVSISKGTKLCKFENAWTSAQDSTHIESDTIHPSSLGQQALFNVLYPVVKTGKWLQELDK